MALGGQEVSVDYLIAYFISLALSLGSEYRSRVKLGFFRCALIAGLSPVALFLLKLL